MDMNKIPNQSSLDHRAGDSDRDATAQRMRDAAAEGRLDFAELEQRLDAVYSSKTLGELEALVMDLGEAAGGDVVPLDLQTRSGSLVKQGYWRVPSHITAECTSGRIKLDFTLAECSHREVQLDVRAKSGSIILVVPKGWVVDLDQATAKSGTIVNRVRERRDRDSPTLHVHGKVLSGRISARYPRRSFWMWLTGHPA